MDASELQFVKLLGEGTSAKVFRGLYRNQEVAIKVLKDKAETKVVEEFRKEFDIMSSLRSPHVVFFYGACIQPSLCMVLEYCHRGSLYDVLSDTSTEIGWERILRAANDTLRGLLCLHSWKPQIVHRDLKTLNLLVDNNWIVKVCDFGLSRFTAGNEENLATLGKLRGTYAYCAPEVYFGKTYSPKADIYSMGIILWEMAFRVITQEYEQPYAEYPQLCFDFQIIIQSAKKDLRPTIPSTCPASYRTAITRCWDPDPEKRPESTELMQICQDLLKEYESNRETWDACIQPRKSTTPAGSDAAVPST